MMNQDLWLTLALFGIFLAGALAYTLRVAVRGRPEYERVNKQGGSALLSKGLMEFAYWMLQPVARSLVFLRITPNMLSWASLGFAILTATCFAYGHFGFGAIFATISSFLDSLDGMVARMTGQSSEAGEVLDAAIDRYAEFLFLGGLIVYYREIPVLMVLALLAMAGSFMVSYSTAKAEALQVDPPKGSMRRPERAFYLTLGAALSPITIPWLEVYREFAVPIGHPMVVALCLVAVMANVSAVERLWAIAKVMREREAKEARAKLVAASRATAEHGDDLEHTDPLKAR